MTFRPLSLSLALALSLGACSADKAPAAAADTAPAAEPAPNAAANAAAAADANAAPATAGSIHVQITGGEHAGTYDVANTDGCSYNVAGKGAWGNQFSRDGEGAKDLTSVQLIVPDAKAAAAGTDTFLLTVGFGPQFGGGTSYTVDTRNGSGKGTVKVEDRTESGTVTFDGTNTDGVRLQGTIECAQVVRA